MLLRRFYNDKLAQASYLIGCQATGESLIVDPNRDVQQYVTAAEQAGLRITHVAETHIHADFVSGVRALAQRTAATVYLSNEGGAEWQYVFAAQDGARLLGHGDSFRVGNVEITALHTPGHTPEHLCFVLTDMAAADQPMGVFTGDFIFVGDVGRPDLLERAANIEGTMEQAARVLYQSLQRFRAHPDYWQVWPAHGAGSACGKALGAVPQSTLGYEKLFNWAFRSASQAEFITSILTGQPEPPKYFAEMKRINKEGPPTCAAYPRPERLAESRLADILSSGALVVDTRHNGDFAEGHVPGTINIPLDKSFIAWAGWLLPYDREFYLIVEEEAGTSAIDEAIRDLSLIGLDRIAGFFGSAALESWLQEGRRLGTSDELSSADLVRQMKDNGVTVLDVREPAEWEETRIPGVANIPLGYLTDRTDEIPRDRRVVLHCREGWRSSIAASLLRANGFENVVNLKGGIRAWMNDGNPVEEA
ncbi:MAG: MBL fold metallo-hydrolase [Gemmatimonadales bacterium]|jgi:hydroxyacylglutathione hydrolase